ncbi:MAG: hypothetical protein SGI73_19750 [Chloroflexota bacterium]|nr:hypothetical protein [Chloroflexota bacterium]
MKIFGVDFSGAQDAGRKTWICTAEMDGDALQIVSCARYQDFPGGSRATDAMTAGLCRLLIRSQPAIWGMDFPFSLPRDRIAYPTWDEFARHFADDYPLSDDFWHKERDSRWRQTDIETKTPLTPCNLRLYRQTYYGIRDVLAVTCVDQPIRPNDGDWRHDDIPPQPVARAVPMQTPSADKHSLIEICPAVTLKRLQHYRPYKGQAEERQQMRALILQYFEQHENVRVSPTLRPILISDKDGDALDAVIAAYATWKALPMLAEPVDPIYRLEGKVY